MERVIPAVGDLSFGFRANAAGPTTIGATGAAFFMRSNLWLLFPYLPAHLSTVHLFSVSAVISLGRLKFFRDKIENLVFSIQV
jgi:hypothetical protein